jgi:enamine deaminase RidA (YjgF/YER057c/UK114 family)
MATSMRRRGVAVTAFALASGTSLAAFGTAAPAGASSTHAPAYYQGVTSANVLSVALHLPSALPALPSIPKNLAVNLVGVTGNATHNTLGTGTPTSSTSVSSVASGSLVKALPAQLGLGKVLTAKLGQNLKDSSLPTIAADPLAHIDVGSLTAKALTGVNSSSSVLTNGSVAELDQLLKLKGVDLLGQLQQNVNQVTDTVDNQLDTALSTVQSILDQTPAGTATAQTLQQVQSTLKAIQAKVESVVNDVLAGAGKTAVLRFDTLDATQSIAPAAGAAQSVAGVNLVKLDVLNGLLTVKGFVSQATAVANGKAGGAHASFSGHAPIVQVGTPLLTATLDETGLNLSDVAGLPADVTDQVNAALAQLQAALNTLLGTLGVHLNYVPGHVDKVDSAGRYAAATGPEYDIVVDSPVPGDGALAEIGLGHGTTASVSAQLAPKHVELRNPQQGALPHTGANLPLIGGIAIALLAGAAVLRRRIV